MGDEGKAVGCVPPTALLSAPPQGRSRQVLLRPAEKNLSKRARQRALPRLNSANIDSLVGLEIPLAVWDLRSDIETMPSNNTTRIGDQAKPSGSVAGGFAVLSCYRQFPIAKCLHSGSTQFGGRLRPMWAADNLCQMPNSLISGVK